MKAGELPLTEEQLQRAFRHLRRPNFPPTLEAALKDPLTAPLVKGLARQMCRQGRPSAPSYKPPTPAGAPPVPATPTELLRRKGPRFDARRAAANDFDD